MPIQAWNNKYHEYDEVILYIAAIHVGRTVCNCRNQTLDVLYDMTDEQTCLYTHEMQFL